MKDSENLLHSTQGKNRYKNRAISLDCFVYGKDREKICTALYSNFSTDKSQAAEVFCVDTLAKVVSELRVKIKSDDLVLFSPACASFDQYENFEQRGDVFKSLVEEHLS